MVMLAEAATRPLPGRHRPRAGVVRERMERYGDSKLGNAKAAGTEGRSQD